MRRCLNSLPFLLMILLVFSGSAAAEVTQGLEGCWKGVILFEEGRIELDMAACFSNLAEDGWKAVLDLPLVGVENLEAETVELEDGRVQMSFDLGDGGGERTITAKLEDDGDRMTGEFHQGARVSPLLLERADSAAAPRVVEVDTLAPGIAALKQRFLGDSGDVRLLLLLSPS